MFYVAIILFIIVLVLMSRLYSIKKEMKHLRKQLQRYNDRKTNKQMDMSLIDKEMEKLGHEINKLIERCNVENQRRIRFEMEQKQAIANMSHDLRTPLTSIVGYLQMAEKEDIAEEERKELLVIAMNRAKRLEHLLKDFFELSIIESNDHSLQSEQVNLKSITIDVLMSFYDRFHEKGLEPTLLIPDEDIFIIADESAVTRVIENLLSNAIHHSDGNIIIEVEEQNKKAKLLVKNDAHSLKEHEVDRIFDRFYMADQSRSGKSTGLGLSIVKSLMHKMNGTIMGELSNGQLSIQCEWEGVE